MMTIQRHNKMGVAYTLHETVEGQTLIRTGSKSIIVDASLDRVSQSWYSWQMGGALIQLAFPYLNSDEREFIMTGIGVAEWNEIFGETK